MNELIEEIFNNFVVDNVNIPVCFLKYGGNKDSYITYMETDKGNKYCGDDQILGYVIYYDFDIYSKGNYLNIVEKVKEKLIENGFMYEPEKDSEDMYENDTNFYHKTLSFSSYKQI